ncbi:MAG: VWA domain-containing protein [Isosphaeraceae bacterium]|nr:VWA domain-containing protein [Isosphaeraceae bacterium]
MRLAEPWWLLLLVLVPLPWLWEWVRPRIAWPSLAGFARRPRGGAGWKRQLPLVLRGLAIAALTVALARPQTVGGQTRIAGRGVAIIAALDHSSSMNARDAGEARSRLEIAKETFLQFLRGRPSDLIGLVAFANYPDEACPPTLDHAFLSEAVRRLRTARPGEDGTNIGDAIAQALGDLERVTTQKKVVLLLTDGFNDPAVPEPLDPEEAARLARQLGVTLHTIAIGRPGGGIVREREAVTQLSLSAEVPGPDLDLLSRLARLGGGRLFVAQNARQLEAIFREIDALEKSPVRDTIRTRYRERYAPWVGAALALLALDRLAAGGRLRRLP